MRSRPYPLSRRRRIFGLFFAFEILAHDCCTHLPLQASEGSWECKTHRIDFVQGTEKPRDALYGLLWREWWERVLARI